MSGAEALVVRRLNAPPRSPSESARAAPGDPLSALRAANPRVAPASLAAMVERARLWRSIPHDLGHGGVAEPASAWRHRGWTPPPGPRRDPFGPEAATAQAPSVPDTFRVLMLRVDFLHDRGGPLSTGNGRFDLSGPDTTVAPIDRPPHNRTFFLAHLKALSRYYDAQSYGRVLIEGDVWPRTENDAYSLSDLADYGPWEFSQDIVPQAIEMLRAALFAADKQARETFADPIPWDDFDRVIIFHAGGDLQTDIKGDSPEDPPTFTLTFRGGNRVIFPDSSNRPIDKAALIAESSGQDGFYAALNGVVAHESGHLLFDFADLYNVFTGYPVDGYWSLMDTGNDVGSPVVLPDGSESFATGLLPPSLDPFHRFILTDALAFKDVTWGVPDSLANGERNPDMRRVSLSSDEYLVMENRYISPGDSIRLDQDSTTRVVLGPKSPDRFEYDALMPTLPRPEGSPPAAGGGILVWHLDASVIPFTTALRINLETDYGFNSEPGRKGVKVVEADGLDDLGDPSSAYWLGSPFDPFFRSNNRTLADATVPNLRANTGTFPHARLDFLDDPGRIMHFSAQRDWQPDGWPVAADFPPGGPLLMALDADGAPDKHLEVCWAGGAVGSADSSGLFMVHADGSGGVFSRVLDRRPRPLMAALPIGNQALSPAGGPAIFAVSTYADTDGTGATHGGQVWLIDHLGLPLLGWPAALPTLVTTPPVLVGPASDARVFVGGADGFVYELKLDGSWSRLGAPLAGGVGGRLAVWRAASGGASMIAAGGAGGDVAVFGGSPPTIGALPGWPRGLGGPGFAPDFLWLDFDANGHASGAAPTCAAGAPAVVMHHADRLWAFCASGEALPGWGRSLGDTLAAGLGAGDADGDGYPEVLTQSITSQIAFINQSGYPSPGWPRPGTREGFRTESPALAVDVDGDRRAEVVALDASGILAALRADGRVPAGWPLATGAGAVGSAVAADLDRDGGMELVAPDRQVPEEDRQGGLNGRFGTLYAYTLPPPSADPTVSAWTMLGGDPGRTSSLPAARTSTPAEPSAGPLERGSLHAFPNPARRQPVAFAYRLTEPAQVDFTIMDSSGREVASFTRAGRRADNHESWEPGAVPAGLYVARLRFRGASGSHSEVITLGLLR